MNVKQLREELSKYPDTMDVFISERKTEFAYGLVNSVRSQEITFSDSPDFEELEVCAKDTVVIIDEE